MKVILYSKIKLVNYGAMCVDCMVVQHEQYGDKNLPWVITQFEN